MGPLIGCSCGPSSTRSSFFSFTFFCLFFLQGRRRCPLFFLFFCLFFARTASMFFFFSFFCLFFARTASMFFFFLFFCLFFCKDGVDVLLFFFFFVFFLQGRRRCSFVLGFLFPLPTNKKKIKPSKDQKKNSVKKK